MTDPVVTEAQRAFTDWFVKNYPGPDTIIHKPEWHAPKIWNAAKAAMSRASPPVDSEAIERVRRTLDRTSRNAELRRGNITLHPSDWMALNDDLRALLSPAKPVGGWRPIETAPKTGEDMVAKPFLGWCPEEQAPNGGDIRVCWWEPRMDGGRWYGDRDLPEQPTHWQPLPAALTAMEGKKDA